MTPNNSSKSRSILKHIIWEGEISKSLNSEFIFGKYSAREILKNCLVFFEYLEYGILGTDSAALGFMIKGGFNMFGNLQRDRASIRGRCRYRPTPCYFTKTFLEIRRIVLRIGLPRIKSSSGADAAPRKFLLESDGR